MRKVALVVAAAVFAPSVASAQTVAPLQAPNATAAGTTGFAVHPGLEVFAQYALRLTNTDAGVQTDNVFDVPRVHASVAATYENVRARVVLEAVRSASEGSLLGVAGDSLILRVREAWGGWSSPRVDVRAGVVPTLTVPEIESAWGLRAVATSSQEATRMMAPADLGLTARMALPRGLGAVAVGVFNGEGYAQREFNRSKNVEGMVLLRPAPGAALEPLVFLASAVFGSSGAGDSQANRATGAALWRGTRIRAGLTFTWAWGVDDRGDRNGWIAEGFVAAEPVQRLLLGARVLRWQHDTGVDADHFTNVVVTAGWRVFRPWEVYLAGTRQIVGSAALQATPASDFWDLRAVSRVVF